ncbi:DUF5074 domain-containing protein [Algoriella sp.]|uniref:DUF5074 domain-containing protein n=1 Tax=Algoriella sp. TaxID=1872434 RepID=UPI002FC9DD27
MNKFKSIALVALAAGLFLQSCSNDDDGPSNDPDNGKYTSGIFILNEGKFNAANADITYYNPSKKVENGVNPIQEIYKKGNGRNLGDVAQSMIFKGNKAYVVVNNSNRVEVMDNTTFKNVATISDKVQNPRYITSDSKYIYVSNWGDSQNPNDDYISLYSISDNKYEKSIPVLEGPGHIIVDNNKLYVAYEESGRFGFFGKSIDIIDLNGSTKTTVNVGDAPTGMVKSGNFLFVLTQGIIDWNNNQNSTGGRLVRIDLANNNNSSTFNFANTDHPDFLVEKNGFLYYALNKDVYKMAVNATNLPTSRLFKSTATSLYGLDVDANSIYVLDAKDFASAGNLAIYNLTGVLQEDVTTGIGPNSIYVK